MLAVELDTEGWSLAFDAGRRVGEEFPSMHVVPGEDQEVKWQAALDRGDSIPASQEALDEAAGLYRDVIVEAMASGDLSDVEPAAELIAELLALDAQETVLAGGVLGDDRSDAWEDEKAKVGSKHHHLLGLTGDLAASLRGETRDR